MPEALCTSKIKRNPFKPDHFQAKLFIKIGVPKCLETTVVMLLRILNYLSFEGVYFPHERLQHELPCSSYL